MANIVPGSPLLATCIWLAFTGPLIGRCTVQEKAEKNLGRAPSESW